MVAESKPRLVTMTSTGEADVAAVGATAITLRPLFWEKDTAGTPPNVTEVTDPTALKPPP